MSDTETYLVTGASGQLGRQVVETLIARGARNIIATSRNVSSLADLAARGIEVRAADFARPETLVPAFRGATRLLIISTQEVGKRFEQHTNAFKAAQEAGVDHIFYTSHSFPHESVSAVAPEHAMTEDFITATGATYTILRNFLYSDNLLMMLAEAISTGAHYGCTGEGRVAFVSRKDVGEANACAMLAADQYKNQILDITGPEAVTYAQICEMASRTLGRTIRYIDLSPEDYKAHLIAKGAPEEFAETLVSFDRSNAMGDGDLVNDMVLKLTGHPPETVQEYLNENLHKADPNMTLNHLLDQHAKG